MFDLVFRQAFSKSFNKLESKIQKQVKNKIINLKESPFLGKKLTGYPYWSLHIGRHRVIYEIFNKEQRIEIIEILERKHDYKELRKF